MAMKEWLERELKHAEAEGFAPGKIKDVMRYAILDRGIESTEQVLALILHFFPQANSGPKDVAWYRWQFRKNGLLPERSKLTPEQRKARKAEYEREYKAKQQAAKDERREAANAERERIERERFEAAVAAAVAKALAERGIE